jgi:two-component system sensor histidine kinase DegS
LGISAYCPKRGYFIAVWDDITDLKANEYALRESKEELQRYARMIIGAQEDERKRIARELHDGIAQNLSSLQIYIENLLPIDNNHSEDASLALRQLQTKIQSISEETSRVSHELCPTNLEQLGLVPTLASLIIDLNKDKRINFKLSIHGCARRLPPDVELALFRIAQEALHNTCKHSAARKCWVQIEFSKGSILMTIADNGQGFDTCGSLTDLARRNCMGIIDMKERACSISGTLDIDSEIGKGSRIRVEIPTIDAIGSL